MYATLGKIFDQTVSNYPKREALVDLKKNKRWTYEEWADDVNGLATRCNRLALKKEIGFLHFYSIRANL